MKASQLSKSEQRQRAPQLKKKGEITAGEKGIFLELPLAQGGDKAI